MKLSIVKNASASGRDMAINVVTPCSLPSPYFYTDIYGLSRAADVGVLFVVVRMTLSSYPAMGILTDKLNTRWGTLPPVAAVVLPFPLVSPCI